MFKFLERTGTSNIAATIEAVGVYVSETAKVFKWNNLEHVRVILLADGSRPITDVIAPVELLNESVGQYIWKKNEPSPTLTTPAKLADVTVELVSNKHKDGSYRLRLDVVSID